MPQTLICQHLQTEERAVFRRSLVDGVAVPGEQSGENSSPLQPNTTGGGFRIINPERFCSPHFFVTRGWVVSVVESEKDSLPFQAITVQAVSVLDFRKKSLPLHANTAGIHFRIAVWEKSFPVFDPNRRELRFRIHSGKESEKFPSPLGSTRHRGGFRMHTSSAGRLIFFHARNSAI
jgi:hypothetical protein